MLKSILTIWVKLKTNTSRRMTSWLGGTHNHYSWYLNVKKRKLSFFIMNLFYSGIELKTNRHLAFSQVPNDAVIVYVNKYKSKFEYLFYHSRYAKEKLPYPLVGLHYKTYLWQPVSRIFRIFLAHLDYFLRNKKLPDPYASGYVYEKLAEGKPVFFSLVGEKGFYRRFVKDKTDPLEYIIEAQKTLGRPIFIIPQLMFFGKKALRSNQKITDILFGPTTRPGFLKRLFILFRTPEKIFIEVSKPVDLKKFMDRYESKTATSEHLALILRRNLLNQINRHRRNIVGPVLKSRQELKENILTSDRLREYMAHYAESKDLPVHKVHGEANEYLDEIAANFSLTMIKVLETILRWMINIMFDGIIMNENVLNKIKFMSLKGPLVLVPCHKSHIDYLILSYILYRHNMQCPHIAAGKNLSFWPIGSIFRRGGAFFIRRTFRGAVLYAKIFSEYVHKMLEEGFNIEFFIEGTRSRSGKLLSPKLGFLSILLNAYKNGACYDLIFVPVYVGYDRVLEEGSYLKELEGAQKKAENLSQLIKARKFLKKRYGKIYIKFHDPMSLNALLTKEHHRFSGMTQKEQNLFCRELGHKVVNAIDENTVVTPHAVVASAILNHSSNRFSYTSLMSQIKMYLNCLSRQKAKLADTLLVDHHHAIRTVLEDYAQTKFIEASSENKHLSLEEAKYLINENKRPGLEYYKNNAIIFFIPMAYTALAILKKDAFQFSTEDIYQGYNFLQELFKNEFTQNLDISSESRVRNCIKAYIDEAAIVPHPSLPDTYNITSTGFRKLKIFSMFLASYLESYLVVINFFRENPNNSLSPKDRIKKIQAIGNRMYKNKEIERKEALSKSYYDNAVDVFISNGYKKSDKLEKITNCQKELECHLNVLRA